MNNTEQQIAKFLEPFNNEISSLAQRLRIHLKQETKPTIELVGDSTLSVNIGYGFTEKAWDCFCAIIVYSKHINISFLQGHFSRILITYYKGLVQRSDISESMNLKILKLLLWKNYCRKQRTKLLLW